MKQRFFTFWLISLAVVAGLIFLADRPALAPEPAPVPVARLKANIVPPVLGARAFLSAALAPDGRLEILAEKNAHQRWPIASITKLFTASVALRDYDPEEVITLDQSDLPEEADKGFFHSGERFQIRELFVPLLLESSNNAATALARAGGNQANFIDQLNLFAQDLRLTDTALFNPNGLDPEVPGGVNYSSVYDLTLLGKWLIKNRPELLGLTRQPSATVRQADGHFHHQAESTNVLLTQETWSGDIVGGKTGQTDLAGKNLLLILKPRNSRNYLINVVLGSPDHFLEMSQLTTWIYQTYQL